MSFQYYEKNVILIDNFMRVMEKHPIISIIVDMRLIYSPSSCSFLNTTTHTSLCDQNPQINISDC